MNRIQLVYLCILLITSSLVSAAPVVLTGELINSLRHPVAYAGIGVVNTPAGTVADLQGRFTLYLTDKIKPEDTVRISLIGYRTLNLTVRSLQEQLSRDPKIVLTEEPTLLNEVRISARDSRVITKGKTREAAGMVTNFALSDLPRQNLGSEIGRVFNTSRGQNRLDKYRFHLISDYDTLRFRINVYQARNRRNLLTRNIYVNVPGKGRNWVEVDLLPYQIVVSDDVIVSVQWIDSVGKGTRVQMPIQLPAMATHLYRYGGQDKWKTFRGMTTAMNLTFTRSKT